jgi:predicted amidohydrolase
MNLIRVALVVQHSRVNDYEKNMINCLSLLENALSLDAHIIVFPEMNLTGYTTNKKIKDLAMTIEPDWMTPIEHKAIAHKITVLVGIAEKKDNKIYASQLVFTPDGYQGVYRKIHTAPFEKTYFSSGSDIPVFSSHGLTFGIQLCYDAHFPELSLAMALKKADAIFIPHASPKGTPEEKYQSWIRHLRARCFDNAVFIGVCNQSGDNGEMRFPGVSLFIGPDGNMISKSLNDRPGIHMVTIDKTVLKKIRGHKMRYFIPYRRDDLFEFKKLI